MSKNAMWLTLIFVGAVVGAFMGPSLAQILSPGTLLILFGLLIGSIVIFCIWALSSNKGGTKAGAAAIADARTMQAPEGKARIYVTRRGFVAALQGMDVTLEGVAKGQIKSGQMLMTDVPPGTYRLHVATAKAKLARPVDLGIDIGPGGVVVVDAMIEMGALKGSVKLTRLDVVKARENVHATKLILWEASPV